MLKRVARLWRGRESFVDLGVGVATVHVALMVVGRVEAEVSQRGREEQKEGREGGVAVQREAVQDFKFCPNLVGKAEGPVDERQRKRCKLASVAEESLIKSRYSILA